MKVISKIISKDMGLYVITIALAAFLTACGGGGGGSTTPSLTGQTPSNPTPVVPADPEPEPGPNPEPEPDSEPEPELDPEPNVTMLAPYKSAVGFQSVLNDSKLQAPTSSTLIAQGNFDRVDAYNEYFFTLSDKPSEVIFRATGASSRSELRQMDEWYTSESSNTMQGHFYLVDPLSGNVDQLTVMQIHDSEALNKPLLRIVWMREKNGLVDHLWAVIKDDTVAAGQYSWIAMGARAEQGNSVSISVGNNLMSITFDEQSIVADRSVEYWKNLSSYYKAGIYLQSGGSTSVYFSELSYGRSVPLAAGVPPSDNFNLDQWKLTLPYSKNDYFGSGGSAAAEIKPFNLNPAGILPLNDGFVDSTAFITGADGAMQFIVDLSDSRVASTQNSSYARSELRELYQWQPGNSESLANWPAAGDHTLQARVSVSDYFAGDPQVVVGQIHAKDSSKALVKLQWDGPTKPVRAIINQNPVSGDPISLYFETVGLAEFDYHIQLNNGELTISVNGNNTQKLRFGEAGMSDQWNDHTYYFKAGNYAQAVVGSNGRFVVNIYQLAITHR